MKKRKSWILSGIVWLFLTGIFGGAAQAANTIPAGITVQYGQTEARKVLQLVNAFRTGGSAWYWNQDNTTRTEIAAGQLQPLTYDYELERAAMKRAMELAVSYSHTRPDGRSCFTAYDVKNTWAGENIAAGYISAQDVFAGWQEEGERYEGQGHRREILSSHYTALGVAQVYYNGYYFWVQEFRGRIGDTAETAPVDELVTGQIDILSSVITGVELMPAEEEVNVPCLEEVPLPPLLIQIRTNSTWPSYEMVSVTLPYTWSLGAAGPAELTLGGITGRQPGETSIFTAVLGHTVSLPVKVSPLEMDAADITLSSDSVTYDGTAKRPDIASVVLDEITLREGSDYEVSCINNINVGTAVMKVTGKGNYTGSAEASFKIQRADISNVTLHPLQNQTYTGNPALPEAVLSGAGGNLKKDTDYTVTCKNNTKAGTGTLLIKGMGNYTGSRTVSFQIAPAAISSCKFAPIAKQIYTGSARKPAVTVTLGTATLRSGTDYTLSYQNNGKVGSATVTITGKGNFQGSIKKKFQIVKPDSLKKGSSITDKKTNGYYKVTKAGKSGVAEVVYSKPVSKNKTTITIPDTITVKGVTYKVTSIATGALRKNQKITKLVIGKNITLIGGQAFYQCKKLKNITVRTTKLTKGRVGAGAFAGIYKKASFKVPSGKTSSYKKLFRSRGAASAVKVTR